MKLIINKNRTVTSVGTWGTENENNYEVLDLEFPQELQDYNKRIVYYLDDDRKWDVILNNRILIPNSVTKYERVKAYIWCTLSEEITLHYICDGTETGDYYFSYNGITHYFTMPEVEENDELIYDVANNTLKLGDTTIETTLIGTGDELNFSTIIDAAEDFRTQLFEMQFYENENADGIIPTQEEVDGFNTMLTAMNGKITEMNQLEEEFNNINISVTKENHVATISVTNIDGTTETVQILDGEAIDANKYYDKDETDALLESKANTSDLSSVATSGDYNDLSNKPTIPVVPTNVSSFTNDAGYITKEVNNLTNYTLKTNTGSLIDLEINGTTYVVTLSLKDVDGNVISTDSIDLPLESVVVGGEYDAVNQKIVLTLENGNTVDIPVGALISGLQTEITSQNKLASDLVDDTNSGNKFTSTSEKSTWNAKYDKPSGGIPKTDLANDVQTSLGNADTAVQNTDYATGTTGGVIKAYSSRALNVNGGALETRTIAYNDYENLNNYAFIGKGTLENVLNARIGDISSALDTINGEVV